MMWTLSVTLRAGLWTSLLLPGCGARMNSVRLFGDDLRPERFPQQVGVGPRVLLEHDVVFADRVRFLLRRQRYVSRRRSRSRLPSLLRSNRRLRSPPLTSRLLPPPPNPRLRLPTSSLPAARSCAARLPADRLAGPIGTCVLAIPTGLLPGRALLRRPDRSVLPRVLRRYVVLRIRRLLQRNRSPGPVTPLPAPATVPGTRSTDTCTTDTRSLRSSTPGTRHRRPSRTTGGTARRAAQCPRGPTANTRSASTGRRAVTTCGRTPYA
jgi:hypothetical protein